MRCERCVPGGAGIEPRCPRIKDLTEGDRIELVRMGEDPDPILPGDSGVIVHLCDTPGLCQIGVQWESGRTLALAPNSDEWKVLERAADRDKIADLLELRADLTLDSASPE